jgi:ubiquinone/menaquinone biosynthesis C-methylase UbiE
MDNAVKCSCSNFYENDLTRFLLGDILHPGGLELTDKLTTKLRLRQHDRVLDVASGRGITAMHIARNFGCSVAGIDLSQANLSAAISIARTERLTNQVGFCHGDAEHLPVEDSSFDAVISECAFCTFPDKRSAAKEMFRVLRPGGRLGLTDMTVDQSCLPEEMKTLIFWSACIADARPAQEYQKILSGVGFTGLRVEDHSPVLLKLTEQIRKRLLMAELAVALKKLNLEEVDFQKGKHWLSMAEKLIQEGVIGYVLITGWKG